MRIDEFDFELPEELIARFPLAERDASRLMVVDRRTGRREHRAFTDLPNLLESNDRLVLNDTKVLPARLRAKKKETGGRVEILLVEPVRRGYRRSKSACRADGDPTRPIDDIANGGTWRAMVNASKPVRTGAILVLERAPEIEIHVRGEEGEGFVLLDLPFEHAARLRALGEIPLPPYLGRAAEESDTERYQTIFARSEAEGSVAAPTAGLHFTPRVFDALEGRAIGRTHLTLHVGPGTFLPVRGDDIEQHRMLPERFEISVAAADEIEATRERGARIVAVGTTVTRVLESIGRPTVPKNGATSLFIRPGHRFSAIDALLTNFHLPRSTLIMLVSAFAGRDAILAAYEEAVALRYRFFSYGDAMLIL